MSASTDLVVIGAGPAGLGAAYRAARNGRRVVVLERADRVGGVAASIDIGGQRVDLGSHRLHPSTPAAILDDLRHLLGDDLQRRERNGRIRLAGRWVGFPLRPADAMRNLPPGVVAGAAWDALGAWARRPRADTFAEHLRAGLGPTLCDRFYFPYARKLWGRAPEEISAVQARKRVSADSPAKIVRRVLQGSGGEKRTFYYPRRGFGQISEALAQGASDRGVELRLGRGVDRVEPVDGGVAVGADGERIDAAHVFSTAPITALVDLVHPAAPARVREAATALSFRAMVLVYLVVGASRYTPFDAHYLPELTTPVTRISEPKNYRDGDDPPDVTVLCAEIPCERGDDVWTADEGALAGVVTRTLGDAGLPEPPVTHVATIRLPRVYPVYEVGFERHFETLDAWAASLPRVTTFGRQGLFVHDNSHHALAMAWAAADALRANGTLDTGAWAAARQRFESHVVED